MMLRARVSSVPRNEALNPRTPVSAATPIATDNRTKKNFPREERISRAAILAAERYDILAIAPPPPSSESCQASPGDCPSSTHPTPPAHLAARSAGSHTPPAPDHVSPAPASCPRSGSAAAAAPAHAPHSSYPDFPSAHPPARSAAAE